MVYLPPELIVEILLKLPVKSLSRFKSVSKSWLSLISDPNFAISHFEQNAARTPRLVLECQSWNQARVIDLNASLQDDSASTIFKFDFLPPDPDPVEILGSCRGFLLLRYDIYLYICNPGTGFHKFVGLSDMWDGDMDMDDTMFATCLHGFGYDPLTDDFLVVRIFCHDNEELHFIGINDEEDDRETLVEYFSVRTNVWEGIEPMDLNNTTCYVKNTVGITFNGAIHWLGYRFDLVKSVIIAFNLTERTCSEIPVPLCFEGITLDSCNLGLFGEFLGLCVAGYPTEIWVMKEYKVQKSWTKSIIMYVDPPFFLISSTKNGDIVGKNLNVGLTKCNAKGQLEEHRRFSTRIGGSELQVPVYTESLLSLSCDTEQAKVSSSYDIEQDEEC